MQRGDNRTPTRFGLGPREFSPIKAFQCIPLLPSSNPLPTQDLNACQAGQLQAISFAFLAGKPHAMEPSQAHRDRNRQDVQLNIVDTLGFNETACDREPQLGHWLYEAGWS